MLCPQIDAGILAGSAFQTANLGHREKRPQRTVKDTVDWIYGGAAPCSLHSASLNRTAGFVLGAADADKIMKKKTTTKKQQQKENRPWWLS